MVRNRRPCKVLVLRVSNRQRISRHRLGGVDYDNLQANNDPEYTPTSSRSPSEAEKTSPNSSPPEKVNPIAFVTSDLTQLAHDISDNAEKIRGLDIKGIEAVVKASEKIAKALDAARVAGHGMNAIDAGSSSYDLLKASYDSAILDIRSFMDMKPVFPGFGATSRHYNTSGIVNWGAVDWTPYWRPTDREPEAVFRRFAQQALRREE